MNYNVVVKSGDEFVILAKNKSLDYLPDTFRKESLKNVKASKHLLSHHKFYIKGDDQEFYGMMLWVKAQGHKDPILIVQLNTRNVLLMYNVKGHLISKESIK